MQDSKVAKTLPKPGYSGSSILPSGPIISEEKSEEEKRKELLEQIEKLLSELRGGRGGSIMPGQKIAAENAINIPTSWQTLKIA